MIPRHGWYCGLCQRAYAPPADWDDTVPPTHCVHCGFTLTPLVCRECNAPLTLSFGLFGGCGPTRHCGYCGAATEAPKEGQYRERSPRERLQRLTKPAVPPKLP